MDGVSTKDRIMKAAMMLFSAKGYDKISMRDIAAEVGIKAASIYNHFPSKRDILKTIYRFYADQQKRAAPSLGDLLLKAETEHPHKVLEELKYEYPSEVAEMMGYALIIASKGINAYEDGESERFVRTYLFDSLNGLLVPVLNRMIELGRIEPIDAERFSYILTYFTFGAAVLRPTDMQIDSETWNKGISMIFSLIKPVENPAAAD